MMWSLLFMSLIAMLNTQQLITGGNTSQSSTYTDSFPYSSERAIDGNLTRCADTLSDNNDNWWTIDLLGLYEISKVIIYNINQDNIEMLGAEIRIGNSSEINNTSNSICTTITNFTLEKNNTFPCDHNRQMLGRFITIYLKQNVLILCEVWIYGTKKGLMLIKENKTWEDSLNYCGAQNMQLAHILDSETQSWAELEAMKSSSRFVWLGLRYTCTLDFWFWVDDQPFGYDKWAPGQRIEECDMSAAMETNGNYTWYSKSDSETFNFICTIS